IIGIEDSRVDRLMNDIVTMSNNPDILDPPYILDPQKHEIDGKHIIYINVSESSQVHKFKGIVYDRSSDGDFKIKEPQRIAAISNRKSGFYSETRVVQRISKKDFDRSTFEKVRNRLRYLKRDHPWAGLSDTDLLIRSGLARKDENTDRIEYFAAAVLLFGTELGIQSIIPQFKIDAVVKINDTDRFDDRKDFRINLIEAYSEIMTFIEKYLPDPFYFEDGQRVSLRNKIFREAVVNLIVHREYFSPFPARIVITKQCVEFTNPCNPSHIGKIDTGNYLTHQKNPLISKFFLQLSWVEEVGTGIYNITKYMPYYTKGAKAEFIEDAIFKTIIPFRFATDSEYEKTEIVHEPEIFNEESAKTTEEVRRVREYISKNYGCKSNNISEDMGIPLRSVGRYTQILRLSGVIKFVGSRRNGGYMRTGYIDLGRINSESGRLSGRLNEGVNEGVKSDNHAQNDTAKEMSQEMSQEKKALMIDMILKNSEITAIEMSQEMNVTTRTIFRMIAQLKEEGHIERVGATKKGQWIIINNENKK
ncbi:MAG: HTH domain-containing protein, partial [Candidatus Delongbacteria bacterium]|nr:HTH domain-containing protein [Candidatus Delongbacteria bacterium]